MSQVSAIAAAAGNLGRLDFAKRRKVIELFDITGVIGIKDGRQYVDIIWCGEAQESRWVDGDGSDDPEERVGEELKTSEC